MSQSKQLLKEYIETSHKAFETAMRVDFIDRPTLKGIVRDLADKERSIKAELAMLGYHVYFNSVLGAYDLKRI